MTHVERLRGEIHELHVECDRLRAERDDARAEGKAEGLAEGQLVRCALARSAADRIAALEQALRVTETWLVDLGADNNQSGPMNDDAGALCVLEGVRTALAGGEG